MAKKHWISVFHSESKENTNTEQISWDSSSSEDECLPFCKMKRKKLSKVKCKISPVTFIEKNTLLLTQDDRAVPSTSFESPVVGLRSLELYKLSPELSQRDIYVKVLSPVIEKRRVRLKKKFRESKENCCPSPDLFDLESTQNITNDSPIFSAFSSQATIKIEPFPSQFSSQVEPTDIQIKDVSLYYEPPKRKKNYKKGGLAHQVNKALKLKKSRLQIWHHEKVNNIESGVEEDQENIIRCKLNKVWNEYGNTLLLCEIIHKNVTAHVTVEKGTEVNKHDFKDNLFLLNIGSNSMLTIVWKKGNVYNFFPPYDIDRVKYCGQDILYYSNLSKFMTCEM